MHSPSDSSSALLPGRRRYGVDYPWKVRIASWNVNSINRRVELLEHWLGEVQPDVVCLQETKCKADDFPAMPLLAAGYESHAVGTGAWNGVAILSRIGLEDVTEGLLDPPTWEGSEEARAVGARCGPLRIWSVYVPNGRTLDHPHYQYKLQWLAALERTAAKEIPDNTQWSVLGDFNIAPTDDDVYDRSAFEGSTHVSQAERDALASLEQVGLSEIMPRPLKYDRAYTYWDYRQLAFPKNRGMRIDLALATPAVHDRVADAYVDRNARKGKGTSDHAPVVIDVDL